MSGQDSVDLPIEILIVEDSPTQLERLGHVLEQHGYKVISAHDGAQALVLLGKSRPAVVVSDIVMPKMTGFELCRRIKADMTTENIPVILLTSLSDPEDVLEGLACGADDFITKPFNQKHLIGHIEQMVVNKDLRKGERARLLTLLISTYESAVLRNTELAQAQDDLQSINEHLEEMVEQKTADLSAEIAERQLVEDALRESEARHRSVVRSANDAIISVDKLGAVKDWNRAAENMFGYSEGEILDRPLVRIIPAHFVDAHQGGMARLLSSGEPHLVGGTVEIEGLHKDGTLIPIELSLSEWQVAGEKFYTAFIRDITERKQAEAERETLLAQIKEQARRIQQVVDTVPEGVLLLDAQGKILLANPVAEEDLLLLAQGRVDDTLTHLGERTLAELLALPLEGPCHEVHANQRTYEIIARPIAHDAQPENWVLVIDDVTQVRDQSRYQQIQERLATVGQLAAGIAHDFNNIMGAIVLYSGMLARSPDISPRHASYLSVITEQADHASKLIRQILDFSRRAPMERASLDLPPLIKEMVKMLERTLPENIMLTLEYDQNEYMVQADPTRLQQALMNLSLNARDAMPGGGRLMFNLTQLTIAPNQAPPLPDMVGSQWVELTVADTGSGILPGNLSHIFEPFFTTKSPGSGTGLGLAQVYGIVKQHDGAIDVTSRVGEGTTFRIYLPLDTDPDGEPAVLLPHYNNPEAIPTGTETVLLVEDNPSMRMAVMEVLEGLGYEIFGASTGIEALALFADHRDAIDLVVTDLVMPEMGGLELFYQLRAIQPSIKIFVMSGHALEKGGYEALYQESIPWIQKPFLVPDLARQMRAILDGAD